MAEEKETVIDPLRGVQQALENESPEGVREILAGLHPADISALLTSIAPDERRSVLALAPADMIGEVLLELPDSIRANLVSQLDGAELVAAAKGLDTDDIADLLPDLSDDVISQILFAMNRQDRQRLDAVLSYAEDTAGGLMNVDTVTVRENITVEVVSRYLRARGELPEDTNKLFVVDRNDRLVGTLQLAKLLTADPKIRVGQLMNRDPVKFEALAPDRQVAAAFERYNLISAPVVDENNRLLGRITVDDVVDVLREEADRSVMAPAGLPEGEDIFAPVARSSRNRALWLGVNLVTAIIASAVIGLFEHTIQKIVALAVLFPIVASMGGNAGTQSVVLVVRGLALGTITRNNWNRALTRELLVAVANGLLWAFVVGVVTIAWFHGIKLGIVMGAAMMINLLAAALAGVLIPLIFRAVGVDPALASGVMLTTVTDVVGFFSVLGLATLFLL
jgi:magnesium transporter